MPVLGQSPKFLLSSNLHKQTFELSSGRSARVQRSVVGYSLFSNVLVWLSSTTTNIRSAVALDGVWVCGHPGVTCRVVSQDIFSCRRKGSVSSQVSTPRLFTLETTLCCIAQCRYLDPILSTTHLFMPQQPSTYLSLR